MICQGGLQLVVIRPFVGKVTKRVIGGKITKDLRCSSFYLEEDILTLYLELKEEDKLNARMMEVRLKEVVFEGTFMEFDKVVKRICRCLFK